MHIPSFFEEYLLLDLVEICPQLLDCLQESAHILHVLDDGGAARKMLDLIGDIFVENSTLGEEVSCAALHAIVGATRCLRI